MIAFEPISLNMAAFHNNIAINRLTNVRRFEGAASDRAGEAVIRWVENPSTAGLVWHSDNPGATAFTIRTVSIDDLVDAGDLSRPRFVKIDVEGAEALVLEGMRRTLAEARPVVFLDCSEAVRERSWRLLSELYYQCQSAITRQPVNTFEEYRHADFLWLPAEP